MYKFIKHMNNYLDIQLFIYMYKIIFKGGDLDLYIRVGLGANLKQPPDPSCVPKNDQLSLVYSTTSLTREWPHYPGERKC